MNALAPDQPASVRPTGFTFTRMHAHQFPDEQTAHTMLRACGFRHQAGAAVVPYETPHPTSVAGRHLVYLVTNGACYLKSWEAHPA